MKITDHNVEQLSRHLREEAAACRYKADRLEGLATTMIEDVQAKAVTGHTFEFIAQEAVDIMTHRSNVHPQFIARTCVSLGMEAAEEWTRARVAEETA